MVKFTRASDVSDLALKSLILEVDTEIDSKVESLFALFYKEDDWNVLLSGHTGMILPPFSGQ